MAKKKGYTLGAFMKEFGAGRKCREYLANPRWADRSVYPKKYLQACLDEYCLHFSRRGVGPRLLDRLASVVGTFARLSYRNSR